MGAQRRATRLFLDADLATDTVTLAEPEAHYLGRVLRLKRGDRVVAFNGRGQEYEAEVRLMTRREAELTVLRRLDPMPEPKLDIVLVQALVKAEAMDLVVQKATELGVTKICPVETEFSVVRLPGERMHRRLAHWNRRAQSACEQCGRHRPPHIAAPSSLGECLDALPAPYVKLALDRDGNRRLDSLTAAPSGVCVLAGPEGGLSRGDLERADAAGFARFSLGPRILRAETASLAGCVIVQAAWGDMRVG